MFSLIAASSMQSHLKAPSLSIMSNRPTIEELSSSSDDDSLDFDSAEESPRDPLADFEKVNIEDRSPELESRDAAASGEPADFTNPDDVEPPKEEVLTVEELPEEEMKSVRFSSKLFFKPDLIHPMFLPLSNISLFSFVALGAS